MQLLPKGRGWIRAALLVGVPVALAAGGACAVTAMPGRSFSGDATRLPEEGMEALPGRLEAHVTHLATTIGARSESAPEGLAAAERYMTEQLGGTRGTVTRMPYEGRNGEVANVVLERPGTKKDSGIVVIGAHYDAVDGTAGADDNASGCAALLELARLTEDTPFVRTVRFEAWVNEEPPNFQHETMGSLVAARAARARGDDIRVAISLETVGYYTDARGSQNYPRPFSLLYPDVGNFIGMVGNYASRHEVREAMANFRAFARIPSEGIAAPDVVPGIGWSDQWSFWQVGYPAFMVTDTAPFRNPGYHEPTDLPADLDYVRMAQVVAGMVHVLEAAAEVEVKRPAQR